MDKQVHVHYYTKDICLFFTEFNLLGDLIYDAYEISFFWQTYIIMKLVVIKDKSISNRPIVILPNVINWI